MKKSLIACIYNLIKMKRLLLSICMMALFPVLSLAKLVEILPYPDYTAFYMGGMRIDSVERWTDKTVLRMYYASKADSKVTVPSCSYLIDERGRRYAMREAEGVRTDCETAIGAGDTLRFCLVYDALPKRCRCFDMVTLANFGKRHFTGIRPKGSLLLGSRKVPKTSKTDRALKKNTVGGSCSPRLNGDRGTDNC